MATQGLFEQSPAAPLHLVQMWGSLIITPAIRQPLLHNSMHACRFHFNPKGTLPAYYPETTHTALLKF